MPPRIFALLIDRDADARKMYTDYLQSSACRIDEAEDGREALAKAIALRPDVIVTETGLPGMSGFELCTLLRRDHEMRTIPIVVITGDASEQHVRLAKSCGADAVLVKPCSPETLLAEMTRLVDRPLVCETPVAGHHKKMLSHMHNRCDTTKPPVPPPPLLCPTCDQPLRYERSHIGGVSALHAEQWDYFECGGACGTFQYRHRTRKLRQV